MNFKIISFFLINIASLSPAISYSQEVISPRVEHTDWYDAANLGIEGKGWVNTETIYDRLPLKAKDVVRHPVWNLSHDTAGLHIRFKTEAKTLKVRWVVSKTEIALMHMPATSVSGIDIYAKDEKGKLRFLGNGRPSGMINEASFALSGSTEYVMYLPLYNGLKQVEIGIPKRESLSKFPLSSVSDSIVFYGTSITQGGTVSRPGMLGTSLVSRELKVPIINLGFSGNGSMDMELADLISELDPAIFVLDNMWNLSPKMVSERAEPFIIRLRESRPNTPILLIEGSSFENLPSEKGAILKSIFAKLKAEGDENLYFLSNSGMLGDDFEGTVDGVHPNDLGMARQAVIIAKKLKQIQRKSTPANASIIRRQTR
ncbi:SGNH/GDSL hydrolase family protein [Paremcibacter congregatus]|uniref:Hydrolase n=1 Tax=Paremcibacter congregatus TaxID=2043170 RepID=A0A2G4YT13_9PROT|nr:SGNH/GDSL hydrolase family protein [Paremcibacter congregatus]PHZ85479.1 hypothetical protein CRD36_06570 [Paremcibacter congregatus]QDE28031.1 hypothetical protein FIV45_12480 [Paremcibacter congregatus]